MDAEQQIFKQGSTTYYWSSKFFPKAARPDLARLYSFVRTADSYVDKTSAQPQKLTKLTDDYDAAITDASFEEITHEWDEPETRVVKNMVRLTHKYKFDPSWVQDFLSATKQDIVSKTPKSLDDALVYVHGSAEVVGLMMTRILRIDGKANIRRYLQAKEVRATKGKRAKARKYAEQVAENTKHAIQQTEVIIYDAIAKHREIIRSAAQAQGRAVQWINFVRDLAEDSKVGRCYFPSEDLKKFGFKDLSESEARANPNAFNKFIQFQIKRYEQWQKEAEKGYQYIPKRLRVPLQTAADMYSLTAKRIARDPFVVFSRKVKPGKHRVVISAARNTLRG